MRRFKRHAGGGLFQRFGYRHVEPRVHGLQSLFTALNLGAFWLLIPDDVGIGKAIEADLTG